MMICTRCEGTGFLNTHQLPDGVDGYDQDAVLGWLKSPEGQESDVQICDCCGDGDRWYGVPGEHYGFDDPPGLGGPYVYNGGYARCH